jgi:hypothetical protein
MWCGRGEWTPMSGCRAAPFTDSPPAWNGSYPYLTIAPVDLESDPIQFKSSILLIKPMVRHDSPVNEFQVDLHSGMFVLRQTDLFIYDAMPLALTRTYRPWDSQNRAFGPGTNHPYDICPTGTRFPSPMYRPEKRLRMRPSGKRGRRPGGPDRGQPNQPPYRAQPGSKKRAMDDATKAKRRGVWLFASNPRIEPLGSRPIRTNARGDTTGQYRWGYDVSSLKRVSFVDKGVSAGLS